MNRSLCLGAAAIGFLCLCPVAVRGQDSQYWTVQYGPVAELPGGVVVGSSRDLSATFYNPGALALTKDPSLLASVESFQATRLKATAQAPVLDFAATEVRPAPSLFSFAFPGAGRETTPWRFPPWSARTSTFAPTTGSSHRRATRGRRRSSTRA